MGFKVTAPLVQVRKADGSYAHVYEGGFLPEDADEDHVAQLVESEFVVEADPPDDEETAGATSRRSRRSRGSDATE